jgi:hypothetical protein
MSIPHIHGLRAHESTIQVGMENEVRRLEARLHVHMVILVAFVIIGTTCFTIGFTDQAVVIASWALSGAQEYIDYLARLG